jgi:hypothetical protein
MRQSIVGFSVAVLGAWLISQPAVAQTQHSTPGAPSTAAPHATVSDKKLDQTAAAIKSMQKVRGNYQQKINAAPPEKKAQIATEGQAAMSKAVTDQGLSVDEYNSIVQLAQNDPSVRDRIMKRLGPAAKQ